MPGCSAWTRRNSSTLTCKAFLFNPAVDSEKEYRKIRRRLKRVRQSLENSNPLARKDKNVPFAPLTRGKCRWQAGKLASQMSEDTVTTIFAGDDSGFQAAAQRVMNAVRGIDPARSRVVCGIR